MSTSTFSRPLVLTEKGVDRLIELNKEWEKKPPKDDIKPYTATEREETRKLLEKVWEKQKQSKGN